MRLAQTFPEMLESGLTLCSNLHHPTSAPIPPHVCAIDVTPHINISLDKVMRQERASVRGMCSPPLRKRSVL